MLKVSNLTKRLPNGKFLLKGIIAGFALCAKSGLAPELRLPSVLSGLRSRLVVRFKHATPCGNRTPGGTSGAVAFSPSSAPAQNSSAQEQPEGKRKIVNRVDPEYPDLARKMQIRGIVKVDVSVAPNGKVKMTRVMGGNPLLAKAAVDAIEEWRWTPAQQETQELIELTFSP